MGSNTKRNVFGFGNMKSQLDQQAELLVARPWKKADRCLFLLPCLKRGHRALFEGFQDAACSLGGQDQKGI